MGALEKVKSYYRMVNGKRIKVSGHARKGDGPNHRADFKKMTSREFLDRLPTEDEKTERAREMLTWDENQLTPAEVVAQQRRLKMLLGKDWDEDSEKVRADKAVNSALDKIKAKKR